jgi:hypothetical protein
MMKKTSRSYPGGHYVSADPISENPEELTPQWQEILRSIQDGEMSATEMRTLYGPDAIFTPSQVQEAIKKVFGAAAARAAAAAADQAIE